MSSNNQVLIKEHEGKFYVFGNVNAESWCDELEEHENELSLRSAQAVFPNRDDAYEAAIELNEQEPTEYGVQFNRLCKDEAEVILVP